MGVMQAAAVPLFLECLRDQIPVAAGRALRAKFEEPGALIEGPLSALRKSFIEDGEPIGASGTRDLERKAYLLRVLAAVADPFDPVPDSRRAEDAAMSAEILMLLEAAALYSLHVVRDLCARFPDMAKGGAVVELRDDVQVLNARPLSTGELAERIGMVYETTRVEALEQVLEASWRARASERLRMHRSTPVVIDGELRWTVDRDAFSAGPRGLSWSRSGTTWFGGGFLCGSQPLIRYREEPALRMPAEKVVSTIDRWRASRAAEAS